MKEEYHLKNISGADAKKILECADYKDIDIEKIIDFINNLKEKGVKKMTDQTNDEKKFSAEEKKVAKYLELHKSENLTYREAVLACLDRSEPELKKEFTEEEKENIQKEKENIEKIEKYISENPEVEYRTAVLTVLGRGELTENEKSVEEFIEKRKKQGIEVTYREAVLTVLDKSEPEPKKEE